MHVCELLCLSWSVVGSCIQYIYERECVCVRECVSFASSFLFFVLISFAFFLFFFLNIIVARVFIIIIIAIRFCYTYYIFGVLSFVVAFIVPVVIIVLLLLLLLVLFLYLPFGWLSVVLFEYIIVAAFML